jgi:hypothetical protein
MKIEEFAVNHHFPFISESLLQMLDSMICEKLNDEKLNSTLGELTETPIVGEEYYVTMIGINIGDPKEINLTVYENPLGVKLVSSNYTQLLNDNGKLVMLPAYIKNAYSENFGTVFSKSKEDQDPMISSVIIKFEENSVCNVTVSYV